MSEQSNKTAAPETIGDYHVHPVAQLFPRLSGEAYLDLKKSIEQHGQQEPIVVHEGVLLDGRNRLEILLELGRQPVIQQYSGELAEEDFILVQNLHRRHLNDDQRLMIITQVMHLKEAVVALERKQQAGKHGRRHETLPLEPGEANPDRHAGETAAKIAAAARTTRYRAEQAIAVAKHAPQLADQVKAARMPLKVAARAAKAPNATKPHLHKSRQQPDYLDVKTKLIGKIHDTMKKFSQRREDLRKAIIAALEKWNTRKAGHAA